jgi:hypothetical protein
MKMIPLLPLRRGVIFRAAWSGRRIIFDERK